MPTTNPGPRPRPIDPLTTWTGQLAASGLCEPLGAGRFRLRVTQAELARILGYGPRSGVVSRKLAQLDAAGRLESRHPVIFTVAGEQADPGRRVDTPGDGARSGSVDGERFAERLLVLAEQHADRSPDVAVAALDALCALTGAGGSPPRGPARGTARGEPSTTTSSFTSSFTSSWDDEPSNESRSAAEPAAMNVQPAETTRAPRADDDVARNVPVWWTVPDAAAGRADQPRAARRDASQLLELLAPLLVECDRRGLGGLTSVHGLLHVLAPVDDDAVRRGVDALCQHLAAGAEIRSPLGVLHALARRGDLAHLPRVAPRYDTTVTAADGTGDGGTGDGADGTDTAVNRDSVDHPAGSGDRDGDRWLAAINAHLRDLRDGEPGDATVPVAGTADPGTVGTDGGDPGPDVRTEPAR